jgi:type I restriction-modification system DNA methylase subunit
MINERVTEDIVRNLLKQLGYYNNKSCVVEEQKSVNSRIRKLLKNASKGGSGDGKPEFIISFKDDTDFLIVIECKFSAIKHESKARNQYKDYAVDGVLHYSNYLSKDYNVMAIAISGETEKGLKISHFLQLKGAYTARDITDRQLLDYHSYKTSFQIQSKPLKDEELIKKAIEYNELLNKHSVPETERNTLISSILIALQDHIYVDSFHKYEKNVDLIKGMLEACNRVLERNHIADLRKQTILHEYNGISHNQKLTSETIKYKKKTHPNMILKDLTNDLKNNVLPFIRENDFDILGRFYREFIRYAGKDAKTGLVLTPTHITDFCCDIVNLQTDDIIYDPCCGTGGFLVSAMKYMINKSGNNINEWKEIKQNRLIGVEVRSDMFTHACSNMMMRGDGKSNIYNEDCFSEEIVNKIKLHKPNKGFLNPPYDVGSDGQLEFIEQALECLMKGGTCAAICQISVGIKQDEDTIIVRERLLKHHTLNAVFSMPDQLFYPKGVVASILVFTAHIPHPQDKEVFFGYLKDDGHVLKRHRGRIDDGTWISKKEHMLNLFINNKSKLGLGVTHHVTGKDEWCCEAYIKTNHRLLEENDFKNSVKEYVIYTFSNNLINKASEEKQVNIDLKLDIHKWEYFTISDFFTIYTGKDKPKGDLQDGELINSIENLTTNNGVREKIIFNGKNIYKNFISVVSIGEGGRAFYQQEKGVVFTRVKAMISKFKMNKYHALFLLPILNLERYRYSYGRVLDADRLRKTQIKLPIKLQKKVPDWEFMENYIKSLPYSSSL